MCQGPHHFGRCGSYGTSLTRRSRSARRSSAAPLPRPVLAQPAVLPYSRYCTPRRPRGPREGGANPPRPRHCNRGRNPRESHWPKSAGKARGVGRSESQETCPGVSTLTGLRGRARDGDDVSSIFECSDPGVGRALREGQGSVPVSRRDPSTRTRRAHLLHALRRERARAHVREADADRSVTALNLARRLLRRLRGLDPGAAGQRTESSFRLSKQYGNP